MGLSRLENFLKSGRGTILYVDPSSLDSTDSIENSGNSLTRPFKTLQRALAEAARFSYQRGLNNDRFNKTTIVLYPGDHLIDNRPGYIPTSSGTFSKRSGQTGITDLTQWDLDTNFDLATPDNALYKLNSVYGGIIVPRGTSIVGMDLRKTRIRPTYVPNPENDNIERSCIFRTTGACYFWQFTILDADPNGTCFKDYTNNTFVPNFSHHKLSGFEYADGVNPVVINDDFLSYSTTRTDLDMYYEKIGQVYGPSSGREIQPDFGVGVVDIQPVIDEYRIVGSKGASVGISSIRAGNGVTPTTTITVDLVETIQGLSVDSPIQISGISVGGYDGQYVVATVLSDTQFTYQVQNTPSNALPGVTDSTMSLVVDTVTSASPYIFNISLRSVYGMCGLLADGDKATGFKSMVVAQYTGIGLQKDDNAFVRYDTSSGDYKDSTSIVNLHTNSRARFKPSYENFHIKATNDAFLQLVSVFAIGYAQHFVTENGGDIALNNSNSNFGAKSLVSSGFKRTAFSQDDKGYITHIIPPKEIEEEEISIEFNSIDVGITTLRSAGAGTTTRLYLYNQTNENILPKVVIDGYHIGAKENEKLNIQIFENGVVNNYSSRVVMPAGPYNSTQFSSGKAFSVGRSITGINSITANVLTLAEDHSFINGESIRIIADNGHLPDGLDPNQIYYVITQESDVGISTNQIRIAKTLNDAKNGAVSTSSIEINNKGGRLSIVSRVSDKNPGDIGHPVQWDGSYWYINVALTNNQIYDQINSLGVASLGNATTRTYVTRKPDSRSLIDTLYRVRYVLPKESTARPPIDGFILQESNDILGNGTVDISQLYNDSGSISNTSTLRNTNFIANASWNSNIVTIRSELPHNLKVGDQVQIVNVSPTGYNGTYTVSSIISAKEFTYALSANPGTFSNNTSARNTDLPYFRRKKYIKTYQVYRTQEIKPYIEGVQDGVYYLTLVNHSNYPTVVPFREEGFAQPIANLYPQKNNDNVTSDSKASVSYALPETIGEVVINEPQNSITKETLESYIVGFGITNIQSSSGTAHTIYTSIDHQFSGISTVSIVSGGSAYGSTGSFNGDLYNATLVGFAGSTTGSNATAKITITSGAITAVKIIDGGSAYGIGNTLRVLGVSTTTGFIQGVVRVESIINNIGDTINVTGVSSALNSEYNTVYRISGIATGNTKEISVVSSESISQFSTTGLGVTVTTNAGYIPTGKVLEISTLTYTPSSGIATVGFTTSHGLQVNNKIRISEANESAFNEDFIVKRLNSLTSLAINVGVSVTTSTSATGTLYAYRPTLTSYGGDLIKDTESTSGRLNYEYGGVTTTLRTQYTTTASDTVTGLDIPNAVSLGLNLGDYLLINNEIFRIRTAVTSDSISILRAVLGSPRQTHAVGSVVRRIHVRPVELRRNSIIRASGHTFEYLGYGPGNYSTSLPEKQDRVLSPTEKLLAQSTRTEGGIVVYTGMDSEGAFYAGNKKINSATGQEEIYDSPIPTVTGEKEVDNLVNITDTQKLFVESSIKVEGGRDKNITSEFDGPVKFNNKVTVNSDIEANSLLIQGEEEISRKISVSDSKPTTIGNYGDIEFNSTPEEGKNAGWIYTTDNDWKEFGWISNNVDLYGVGISSGGGNVGFSTLLNIVAIGITLNRAYDVNSGITTLTFTGASPLGNTIGIYTGSPSTNVFAGNSNAIKFVGSQEGFGINFTADHDSVTGFTTITIKSPLDPISFGSSLSGGLGLGAPTFSSRSTGTRIVYYDTLSTSTVDYATGITGNSLWWSVPNSNRNFLWYGGTTNIATLNGSGNLTLSSNLYANSVFLSENITLSGNISATSGSVNSSTLSVTNNSSLNTLNVSGISTFNSRVNVNGNVSVGAGSSFIGNGTIPFGGIIMWSGAIANIPTGWALCNGSNGTPDLRDRFIVGAGSNYSVAGVGGTTNSIVVAHTHTGTTSTEGSHTHEVLVAQNSSSNTNRLDNADTAFTGEGGSQTYITDNGVGDQLLNNAGIHSHTITVNSTGSSGTNANLPPYYALAFIMRTA